MSPSATSLAVTHGTIACLAGVATVAVGVVWPEFGGLGTDSSLRSPAMAVQLAAICYLAVTAVTEIRWARLLRSGMSLPASLWPLMGHVWVLMVAGGCIARGPASRAHLVGFDRTLSVLATISLLCVVALFIPWCFRNGARSEAAPASGEATSGSQRRQVVQQLVAGTLLVLSLWWLESRPWKTRFDASAAASSDRTW